MGCLCECEKGDPVCAELMKLTRIDAVQVVKIGRKAQSLDGAVNVRLDVGS